MKKSVLVLCLAVLIAGAGSAQSTLGFGVKGGLNLATQVTSGPAVNVDTNGRIGVHLGGYASYGFGPLFAVLAELQYSQKGSNWTDPYYDVRERLNYLDLSILAAYRPVSFLNVHAGPLLGYLFAADMKAKDGSGTEDVLDYYRKLDFGLALGVTGYLPHNLFATMRYVYGLAVTTNDSWYIDPWKNSVLQASVGYRIRGGF